MAEQSPTDESLARAAQSGDRAAFVEIVARHQALVCGTAYGILNDFAASEDAAQEAFLNAWRKIGDLREPARLRPWLARIARNAALGKLRGKRDAEALDSATADDAPLPDEITANDEEAALVREHLAALPENYRTPLVLFYREGQSVRAVAQALDLSEDAVKQRLARGRAQLRDRMSGLIESTLERTAPSAVFTMAVATAIGALKAPAAVAATAFSGSAAVATATTATTTTTASQTTGPILTAMTASNAPYLTAAIIAAVCVPIGYTAHMGIEKDKTPPPAAATPLTLSELEPRDPAEAWPDSELLAEWRRLHEIHGTGPESMVALFDTIQKIPEPFRRRAFRAALVAEWAQLDPAGAFAHLTDDKDGRAHRWQVFDEWLKSDPEAAVDVLITEPKGWAKLARNQLKNIAREAPGRVGEIAARLPESTSYWAHEIPDAFAILAAKDLDKARAVAGTLSGKNRSEALAGIAKHWAKSDPDAAIEWARSLSDDIDRDEVLRHAIYGLATHDPAAALGSVGLVPPGGSDFYFASTTGARTLQEASQANFEATVAWLADNPDRFSHQDVVGMARSVTTRLNKDPAGFLQARVDDGSLAAITPAISSALLNDSAGTAPQVWEWLETQGDSKPLDAMRNRVLDTLSYKDPEAALRLAESLLDRPSSDQLVHSVIQSALQHGRRINQIDRFLEISAEPLHEPLVAFAFERMPNLGQPLQDPMRWAERLDTVPEPSRPIATRNLTHAWSQNDPEAAAAWATQIADDTLRRQGITGVADSWSASDPHTASGWISGLAEGAERDAGAISLSRNIAATLPHEALEWSASISDPTLRQAQLRTIAATINSGPSRDAIDLRGWAETADLSPADRGVVIETIANPPPKDGNAPLFTVPTP